MTVIPELDMPGHTLAFRKATGINDLSDYIQNIKNVKPPKGSMVIRGSSTEEVKDGDYKLTKPDNKDIRATLDAHPAEDYMAGGTK